MLLWLPVFNGNALAATVLMQHTANGCDDAAAMQAMPGMDMEIHMDHQPANCGQDNSCESCGVCHLACTGYLTVPRMEIAHEQSPVREFTPYLVIFDSFVSAPLVPPPLVRA